MDLVVLFYFVRFFYTVGVANRSEGGFAKKKIPMVYTPCIAKRLRSKMGFFSKKSGGGRCQYAKRSLLPPPRMIARRLGFPGPLSAPQPVTDPDGAAYHVPLPPFLPSLA